MGLQQEVQTLRMVPMFSQLDPARLKLISFASERVQIMPGEEFIREGEEGEDAFVVLSGRAEVTLDGADSHIKLGEVAENQIVGMIALLSHGRRTATVRALEPLECLRLPRMFFIRWFGICRILPLQSCAICPMPWSGRPLISARCWTITRIGKPNIKGSAAKAAAD